MSKYKNTHPLLNVNLKAKLAEHCPMAGKSVGQWCFHYRISEAKPNTVDSRNPKKQDPLVQIDGKKSRDVYFLENCSTCFEKNKKEWKNLTISVKLLIIISLIVKNHLLRGTIFWYNSWSKPLYQLKNFVILLCDIYYQKMRITWKLFVLPNTGGNAFIHSKDIDNCFLINQKLKSEHRICCEFTWNRNYRLQQHLVFRILLWFPFQLLRF